MSLAPSSLRPKQNGWHFADDVFKGISGMKIIDLKFHIFFFVMVQLINTSLCDGLVPDRLQVIIWTNESLVHRYTHILQ